MFFMEHVTNILKIMSFSEISSANFRDYIVLGTYVAKLLEIICFYEICCKYTEYYMLLVEL